MWRRKFQKNVRVSLKNDLKLVFSMRWFRIILTLSIGLRLIIFFFLPNRATNFAPDEDTYASLAQHVAEGLPVDDFPKYGPRLYNTSRSLILPSSALIKLGLSPIDSVRIIASIYGVLLLVIVALIVILVCKIEHFNLGGSFENFSPFVISAFCILAFMPSHLVWSVLGLRESASHFWISASFLVMLKVFLSKESITWKSFFFLVITITLSYGARRETALVFSVYVFGIALILGWREKLAKPLLAIALGVLGGVNYTTTPEIEAITNVNPTSTEIVVGEKNSAELTCQEEEGNPKKSNGSSGCKNQTLDPSARSLRAQVNFRLTESLMDLSLKRNINRVGAVSALPLSKCNSNDDQVNELIACNLQELPFRLLSFTSRPFVFFDVGSKSIKLASIENIIWICCYFVIAFRLKKIHTAKVAKKTSWILLGYIVSFTVAASLYEGNLGTAFRHRSSILWPIISLIMILYTLPSKNAKFLVLKPWNFARFSRKI